MLTARSPVKIAGLSLVCICVFGATLAFGQTPPRPPRVRTEPAEPPAAAESHTVADSKNIGTGERSIAVDANANIKVCVLEGSLKINGWNRSEVRIFVKSGSLPAIRTLEKSAATGKPVWLLISPAVETTAAGQQPECLSGERIEIDVPMTASLSVTGRRTETTVDSVKSVQVKNVEGNITLRNIAGGITAVTYQGDVTVDSSSGAISLESGAGNVVGFQVSPGQIGDVFRAKTNSGSILLQNVEHRQIEANSITGTVSFDGRFLTGGLYEFRTSNGAIRLKIPEKSSSKFVASYGFGEFTSSIPIKASFETAAPGGKNFVGTLGAGEATVNLTTSSGSISIIKQ